MVQGFEVTQRAPGGQPREVRCRSHPDCSWTLATPNALSEEDPILKAMFARHMSAREAPGARAGGHTRRPRM